MKTVAMNHPGRPAASIRTLYPQYRERIGIRQEQGIECIYINDILCCEAWSNYCKIFLKGKEEPVIVSKPLKHILSVLPEGMFFRSHQSFLIRLDAIRAVSDEIILSNGMAVPLSRRQKPGFMKWLNQHIRII